LLGESVLAQIIPVLHTSSLYAGDEHTYRGVCVRLAAEVLNSSTKERILRFMRIPPLNQMTPTGQPF
jgi:hypothetical protein